MRLIKAQPLFILFLLISGGWNGLLYGRVLTVADTGDYAALPEALAVATDGDTLAVYGGSFNGPIRISTSITLLGYDLPIIDGQEHGTVIEVNAPHVHLRGFRIQNSGISLSNEDAGISVNAPDAHIENNHIENVLFGIYLRKAHRSVIANNLINGKADLAIPRRGDLIRAWYSNEVRIEHNRLIHGRDMIIWFSKNSVVRGNTVTNARYGVHFMYSDDCLIEENVLTGNSVGVYMMYSRRLTLRHNTIAYNRGPSGFGIGLKDFDDGVLEENLVVDNRVGVFVDNSPRSIDSKMTYHGNVFAYNDVGFSLLSFVKRSYLTDNSFIENYEQVGITGAGHLTENHWDKNYWSDYAGYDNDHDGFGDIPYKSEKFFENLMNRKPRLRLFIYSPAIQAVDFAARAFPMVKPYPKLIDQHPRIRPLYPTNVPGITLPTRQTLLAGALGLVFLSLFIYFGLNRFKRRFTGAGTDTPLQAKRSGAEITGNPALNQGADNMITVTSLNKKFGKIVAVNNLSFAIAPGETVALWGSNGAGKTTVLRCLLGIIPFEGDVFINGFEVRKQSKQARRLIGFVPQEISFHDNLTLQETIEFYARLKKTSLDSLQEWIDRLGLTAHISKTVKELSGGMKQRLALAIALLANPPILFLDEPTANLDMHSRDDFLELLGELKQDGKTIVYSSHRLEEVFGFADRILVLDQGQMIADSPPSEVYQQLGRRSMLRIYVPEKLIASAIRALQKHGFQATRNGVGIKVQVDAHSKGEPIIILANEGVEVQNFDYEIAKE